MTTPVKYHQRLRGGVLITDYIAEHQQRIRDLEQHQDTLLDRIATLEAAIFGKEQN